MATCEDRGAPAWWVQGFYSAQTQNPGGSAELAKSQSQNPGHKVKTQGITQTGTAGTLLTINTKQTGNKGKEDLAYIHKRAEKQQDTGETGVCFQPECVFPS